MDTNGIETTPRRKAATATKGAALSTLLKVVASRYAQVIQQTNLAAKAPTAPSAAATRRGASSDRNNRPAVASSSGNIASIKVSGSTRGSSSRTASQTRTAVVSKASIPSTPVTTTAAVGNGGHSAGASSSDSNFNEEMSISEKLRIYRANKASRAGPNAPSSTTTTRVSRSASSSAITDPPRTISRPTLPERITPPTEKATSKPLSRGMASGSRTPIKRRATTPIANDHRGRGTPRTIAGDQTKPVARSVPVATAAVSSSMATAAAAAASTAARVPSSTTEEELELLECMYMQLCFTEARAAQVFHSQEQSAKRQMVTAWNILQSKLQLLHDTSIRLDRELHTRTLEDFLGDQADPFVRLASKMDSFNQDLLVVSRSLEASLQRMPTPDIICSPPELKRQLDGLASTLEAFLSQLRSDGIGSTVTDALQFSQRMEESTDQISSLLLQVGQMIQAIQVEVTTETSLKAHRIQDARVEKATQRECEWW